jgi:hypothetical protein
MKSNAPGQLLGYSIQFPRALYHLLVSGPGDSVCVEVLGDVATLKSDSEVITEEDKSSINGNPLTDKSTDLWKTFYNWIKAVNDKELNVGKTKFLLYTNQNGRPAIVHQFSLAQSRQDAQDAVDYAKEQLSDIKDNHEIWPYYDYVVNRNESLFLEVVERFELQVGKSTGYDEVLLEIRRKIVAESQIEFLAETLSGWLLKSITELIIAKQPAIIRWEEFNQCFIVLFERCRRRELIDFTLQNPPEKSSINQALKIRPCYLKQLESIKTSDDDLIEAVSDYLRAKVNRDKWIECGIIDVAIASDFEAKLIKFWKSQEKRVEITEKELKDYQKGQLIYGECISKSETIRGESPPSSTIAGTYHALADEPTIGWHPNWKNLFLKQMEE